MTSNAGAAEQAKAAVGFGRARREGEDTAAIERTFTRIPQPFGRSDQFGALPKDVILKVVEVRASARGTINGPRCFN